MKTYDDITIKEEKDRVIFITPSMTRPLIMANKTWRAILADNVKKVMRGDSHIDADSITTPVDSVTATNPINLTPLGEGDLR